MHILHLKSSWTKECFLLTQRHKPINRIFLLQAPRKTAGDLGGPPTSLSWTACTSGQRQQSFFEVTLHWEIYEWSFCFWFHDAPFRMNGPKNLSVTSQKLNSLSAACNTLLFPSTPKTYTTFIRSKSTQKTSPNFSRCFLKNSIGLELYSAKALIRLLKDPSPAYGMVGETRVVKRLYSIYTAKAGAAKYRRMGIGATSGSEWILWKALWIYSMVLWSSEAKAVLILETIVSNRAYY